MHDAALNLCGRGYEKNEAADIMYMRKQQMFPEKNMASGDTAPTKLTSSASDLQTVLESMYNLGRLIKRMPDDRSSSEQKSRIARLVTNRINALVPNFPDPVFLRVGLEEGSIFL